MKTLSDNHYSESREDYRKRMGFRKFRLSQEKRRERQEERQGENEK